MEQEAMEDVLHEGPHNVTEEEARQSIQEGRGHNTTSDHCFQRSRGVDKEGRKGVWAQGELNQGTDEDVRRDW